VPQFVRVDHSTYRPNGVVDDIEFHNSNEAILLVQKHGTWLSVHIRTPDSAPERLALDEQTLEQPGDAIPSMHGVQSRRNLASSISVKNGISSQHVNQTIQIALLARVKETSGEFITFLARGFEPRLTGLDMTLGSGEYLAAVVLSLLDDPGYLVISIVENFA
jgi:hypothetical protein